MVKNPLVEVELAGFFSFNIYLINTHSLSMSNPRCSRW
jgi:hypothetical protein